MGSTALLAHLRTGTTTVCQAWALIRRDGVIMGFTDHDRDLEFEGIVFRASTGFTARALQQTTGLSVDNTEAVGALSDAAITEADVAAGRYDGAEVRVWLVNWADVGGRTEQFRGRLGEIVRSGASFRAELRGVSDVLNQPRGDVYQRSCAALLGDARCGFDLSRPGFSADVVVGQVTQGYRFVFTDLAAHEAGWFERGRMRVLSGPAAGLIGTIKTDRLLAEGRVIELWQRLGLAPEPGDALRLEAGCDKAAVTCRLKFSNFLNFRGFPHIPGEDWLASYPVSDKPGNGKRR